MSGPGRWGRLRRVAPYGALVLLALAMRVWMPGPVQVTTDEPMWLLRSQQFSRALGDGDLAQATAWGAVPGIDTPTMPGVTTMWAGTAGRGLTRLGSVVGVNDPLGADPLASAALVRWSRTMVALFVSIGIGLFAWASTRLVGRRAGFVAGVLCAVEPWFVGHGFVLHTDAMVTIFGITSLVALLAALRGRDGPVDRAMLVLSAVTGGLAMATKLNGVVIVGGGAVVVGIWDSTRRAVTGTWGGLRAATRRLAGAGACWIVGVVVVFVAVWPAVWVGPGRVLDHLRASAQSPAELPSQFFRGAITPDPGWTFYPVTTVFRLSPWLLVGLGAAVVLGVAGLVTGRSRGPERMPGPVWILALALVPYFLVVAFYARRYDRYGLVAVPVIALLTAVVLSRAWTWLAAGRTGRWRALPMVAAAVAVVSVLATAPYQIAYIDPALGGQKRAVHVMMLGWGESGAALGREIARRESGRCADVGIVRPYGNMIPAEFPCGRRLPLEDVADADYLVVDISQVQRGFDVTEFGRRHDIGLSRIDAVTIGGVDYGVLYEIEPARTVSGQ